MDFSLHLERCLRKVLPMPSSRRATEIALTLLFLGAGCASSQQSFDWIEADVLHSTLDSAEAETVLYEGSSRVLTRPGMVQMSCQGKALVFPEGEANDGKRGTVERRSVRSVACWDYKLGRVWSSSDGGPFTSSLLAEVVHEERNRLCQDRMEMLEQFLCTSLVREREDLEICWGDLRVLEGPPTAVNGEEAEVRYLAVEPGEYWEVVLAPKGSPFESLASRELCLAAVLGLSAERSRLILQRLGAMPTRVTSVRLVPDEERLYIGVTTFVEARRATEAELLAREGLPTPGDLELAAAADSIVSVDEILDLLRLVSRGEKSLPSFTTALGWCLKLSERLRPEEVERVVGVCAEAGDALIQVELARAALRAHSHRAWQSLRPLALGRAGLTGMNIAEALVAERSQLALSCVFHILLKRNEYVDVDPRIVQEWALRHIRALSDVPVDEILAGTSHAPPDPNAGAGFSGDLDFWLRWHEGHKERLSSL